MRGAAGRLAEARRHRGRRALSRRRALPRCGRRSASLRFWPRSRSGRGSVGGPRKSDSRSPHAFSLCRTPRATRAERLPDGENEVVVVLRLADHRDPVGASCAKRHLGADTLDLRPFRAFDPKRCFVAVEQGDGAMARDGLQELAANGKPMAMLTAADVAFRAVGEPSVASITGLISSSFPQSSRPTRRDNSRCAASASDRSRACSRRPRDSNTYDATSGRRTSTPRR
jgi:hypothetical protein